MKKTRESIEIKWKKAYEAAYAKIMWGRKNKIAKLQEKNQADLEKKIAKIERKTLASLKKKEQDCDRKCKNEIRKLEWKPEREYKKKVVPFKTLEFAMDLQQENSKLRDTDSEWRGFCISCDRLCEWHESHWGHDISRRVKNICIDPRNINLQCKNCNLITWPLGNVELKWKTEQRYNENLDKKYWAWTAEALQEKKRAYFTKWYETNWDYGQWKDEKGKPIDINKWIERLIEENTERWKSKSFYKPKKNWKKVWENRPH